MFQKVIAWIKRTDDPVHSCAVYKDKAAGSCTHVDGFLCDMKTCNMLSEYLRKEAVARQITVSEEELIRQIVNSVIAEQRKQRERGYTAEHDQEHKEGELARLAAAYALPKKIREQCVGSAEGFSEDANPQIRDVFLPEDWGITEKMPRIKELTVAAALLVSEIARLRYLED